jgi:hypothetical protein
MEEVMQTGAKYYGSMKWVKIYAIREDVHCICEVAA